MTDGTWENWQDVATYGKGWFQGLSGPMNNGTLIGDLLGNPYALGAVGSNQVAISSLTKSSLAGVGIDWGAY